MEKKTYKIYYTTSDFRYNGDDYYLSKDGLVELIASSEGELREKINVETHLIKNCAHHIPIEASSIALNYILKNF